MIHKIFFMWLSFSFLSADEIKFKTFDDYNNWKAIDKKIIFPKEWSIFKKLFNQKNLSRKECLKLPFKTLSKALRV